MPEFLEPTAYRRWYETPLGRRVDADEKAVVFGLADLKPGEQVLDVGCGDGNYTGRAAERAGSAVGLDRSPEMLHAAEPRLRGVAGLRWVEGDATNLPFDDATFDAILIVTVLCFSGDPQKVVAEAFRVLRPGGRLVLGELGRYSSWAAWRHLRGLAGSRIWRNARFFSLRELRDLLRRAGFSDLSSHAAVYYPPSQLIARASVTDLVERIGRRWWPWAGAFLVVRGRRT
jgi:ubiquinone/menaquinone biosynthesis C-methylase UbiE